MTGHPLRRLGARVTPGAALVAAMLVGLAVLLLEARDQWFFNDDWGQWGTNRVGPGIDEPGTFFFGPHNGHWMSLNRFVFEGIYRVFGLQTYLPYLVPVLAVHFAAVWVLFLVARRAGVRPWLACAGAVVFAWFGSGAEVLTWADAFGFAAPLAFGGAQLLLVDHRGPIDRRDVAGLAFGLLSIVSGGASLTMIVVVALSLVLQRRWRAAVFAVVPPGLLWMAWFAIIGSDGERTLVDREHVPNMAAYFWRSISSSAESVTQIGAGGLVVVALVVFAWWNPRSFTEPGRATVAALAGGLVLFALQTTLARVNLGVELASSSRYLYLGGFLILPLLLLAFEDVARRQPRLLPAMIVLLLWAAVANAFAIDGFTRSWGPRKQAIRDAVAAVSQLDGLENVPGGTRLVDPQRAFEPEWAPTVDVIRALRDNGDLPTFDAPLEADRLAWATRLLVRPEPSAGGPGVLAGEVRDESNVVVQPDGGCVDLVAVTSGIESTVRLSGLATVWIEAPLPTPLEVRLVSSVDGSLGEAVVIDGLGVRRLHVGVERTTTLVTFAAPTLRMCG